MFEFPSIADLIGQHDLMPYVHGEADGGAGGGLVGLLDNLLENVARAMEAGAGIELMPGLKTLGPNLHPSLVHFPIAFLSIFFLLEVLGIVFRSEKLKTAASAMLYCGTVGAALAAVAGLYAASIVPHGLAVHEIMEWHQRLGLTVTALALILSVWRLVSKSVATGMARALYLFLAGIMTVSMFFGADLGGLMVYQHGVAVSNLQQPDEHHHHGASTQQQK